MPYTNKDINPRQALAHAAGPYLAEEDKRALIAAWQDKRDEGARTKLVETHNAFCWMSVNKFLRFVPACKEDLHQEAIIGLMEAIDNFDLSYNNTFMTYAAFWIERNLRSFVATNQTIQSRPRQLPEQDRLVLKEYRKMIKAHEAENLGRELTVEEQTVMEEKLGMSLVEVEKLYCEYYSGAVSLSEPLNDETNMTRGDMLADTRADTFAAAAENTRRRYIDTHLMSKLGEKERLVIEMRYLTQSDDIASFAEIGRMIGCTKQRVQQVEAVALRKLKRFGDRRILPD